MHACGYMYILYLQSLLVSLLVFNSCTYSLGVWFIRRMGGKRLPETASDAAIMISRNKIILVYWADCYYMYVCSACKVPERLIVGSTSTPLSNGVPPCNFSS